MAIPTTSTAAQAAGNRPHSTRWHRPGCFLGAAIGLTLVAVGLRLGVPLYRQHRAIREIERLGGVVQVSPRGPEWLRKRLGDERLRTLGTVTRVNLSDSTITDSEMFHLAALPDLQWLSLDRTAVTDDGLMFVKELRKLQTLLLNWTPLTDKGLTALERLTELKKLDLGRTQVTDSGLVSLKQFINLEDLDLGGTDVTDAGLRHLQGLTSLRRLILRSVLPNKRVTTRGIQELQRTLPDLKVSS